MFRVSAWVNPSNSANQPHNSSPPWTKENAAKETEACPVASSGVQRACLRSNEAGRVSRKDARIMRILGKKIVMCVKPSCYLNASQG